jgi:hypothetical protein
LVPRTKALVQYDSADPDQFVDGDFLRLSSPPITATRVRAAEAIGEIMNVSSMADCSQLQLC